MEPMVSQAPLALRPPLPPPSNYPRAQSATLPQAPTLTVTPFTEDPFEDPFAEAQAIRAGTLLGAARDSYSERLVHIYSSTRSGRIIDTVQVPARVSTGPGDVEMGCTYVRASGPPETIDAIDESREMVPIDQPEIGAVDLKDFKAVASGMIFEVRGDVEMPVFKSATSNEYTEMRQPGQFVVAAGRPQVEGHYTMLPIRPNGTGFVEMRFCQITLEQEAIRDRTTLRCVKDGDVVDESGVPLGMTVSSNQEYIADGVVKVWSNGCVMVPIKQPAGYVPLEAVQVQELLLDRMEDSDLEETVLVGQPNAPPPSPDRPRPGQYSKSAKPQGEPQLPETTIALMISVPWLIFTVLAVSATMWPQDIAWITYILLCVAVIIAIHYMRHTREGYFVIGLVCLFSLAAGDMWGLLVQNQYMDEYWRLDRGASHARVAASGKGASAFSDASTLDFQRGTFIDTERTLGYMELGEVYCVAPVTGEAYSASPLYYAVGKNCCDQRNNFKCGKTESRNGRAMKALVVNDDAGQYQTALRMLESVYNMKTTSQKRIFVNFPPDVDGYQDALLMNALKYDSAASIIWSFVCIGFGLLWKDNTRRGTTFQWTRPAGSPPLDDRLRPGPAGMV